MVVSFPEGRYFTWNPEKYSLQRLVSDIHEELANAGFIGATNYICTHYEHGDATSGGVLYFDASSSTRNFVVQGLQDTTAAVNDILYVYEPGANKGVWLIYNIVYPHCYVKRLDQVDLSQQAGQVTDNFELTRWEPYNAGVVVSDDLRKTGGHFRKSFTGRDYYSIRDEVVSHIKKNFPDNFNNFVASDLGIVLIEMLAYFMEGFYWYQDFVANELSLSDAKMMSSVSKIVRFLGYKPKPTYGSSTTCRFTLTKDYSNQSKITVPVGFKVKTENGLIFETIVAGIFTSTALGSYIDVAVRHGETSSDLFTSSGKDWQEFSMSSIATPKVLLGNSVAIAINSGSLSEWQEVDLFEFSAGAAQFEVDYWSTPPIIKFGSKIIAIVPPESAQIKVFKRTGFGALSNVPSGSIKYLVDSIAVDNVTISMSVSNIEQATGGADAESIESVRLNAPKKFLTSDRAVTQNDWDTLSSSYPGIAKAKAHVLRGLGNDSRIDTIITNMTTYKNDLYSILSDMQSGVQSLRIGQLSNEASTMRIHMDLLNKTVDVYNRNKVASDNFVTQFQLLAATIGTLSRSDFATAHQAEMDELIKSYTNLGELSRRFVVITNSFGSFTGEFSALTSLLGSLERSSRQIVEKISVDFSTQMLNKCIDISEECKNVKIFVEGIISSERNTNHVLVNALSKDSSGYYVAPSTQQLDDLFRYLNNIRLINTTVEVVSGANMLRPVTVDINVKLKPTALQSDVINLIQNGVDGLLKDREFNESLYLSDVYSIVMNILHVDYAMIALSSTAYPELIVGGQFILTATNTIVTKEVINVVCL